jgi:hypothetical protein
VILQMLGNLGLKAFQTQQPHLSPVLLTQNTGRGGPYQAACPVPNSPCTSMPPGYHLCCSLPLKTLPCTFHPMQLHRFFKAQIIAGLFEVPASQFLLKVAKFPATSGSPALGLHPSLGLPTVRRAQIPGLCQAQVVCS